MLLNINHYINKMSVLNLYSSIPSSTHIFIISYDSDYKSDIPLFTKLAAVRNDNILVSR